MQSIVRSSGGVNTPTLGKELALKQGSPRLKRLKWEGYVGKDKVGIRLDRTGGG